MDRIFNVAAQQVALVLVIFLVCTGMSRPVLAPAGLEDLKTLQISEIKSIIDGDTVQLTTGQQVRLTGIRAAQTPELATQAATYLQNFVGQPATLMGPNYQKDRHGRLLAQVVVDGHWLQQELVEKGLAHVYTFDHMMPLNLEGYSVGNALRQAEIEARHNKHGLWASELQVLTPAQTFEKERQGQYVIVEGQIQDATLMPNKGYLNFGDNWRNDFTVAIDKPALTELGPAFHDLAGHRVRARGWLAFHNGPILRVNTLEQIEFLKPTE